MGVDKARWLLAPDLLKGSALLKTNAAFVIGGGLVGLEVTDFLTDQGKEVAVIEMLHYVGADMDALARSMLLGRLMKHNVTIHTSTKVSRLTKKIPLPNRMVVRFNSRSKLW